MKYHIILTSSAQVDINSAVHWYKRINPKIASRFLLHTRITLKRIRQDPNRFRIIRGAVRRALVVRFPYSIYFFLRNEQVFVLAVRHQRQSDILRKGGDNGHA